MFIMCSLKLGFFLSYLQVPKVASIDEVQRIVCSAQGTLGVRGKDNRLFTISFRGFVSESLWVFDYIDPSMIPTTSTSLSNHTLLERLLSLPSLPNATLSSNSTTGRICPSLSDIDTHGNALIFITDITFISSISQPLSGLKIVSGASGDVPSLVLTKGLLFPPDKPIGINGNKSTSFFTPSLSGGMEVRRGSAPAISEVQIITATLDDVYAASGGLYFLKYSGNSQPLPAGLGSTAMDLSQAIASLLQTNGYGGEGEGVDVVVSDSSSIKSTGFKSLTVVWTLTFPSTLGPALLLQLTGPANMTGLTIAVRRVVEGFYPTILTGRISLQIPIGTTSLAGTGPLSYSVSVPISQVSN